MIAFNSNQRRICVNADEILDAYVGIKNFFRKSPIAIKYDFPLIALDRYNIFAYNGWTVIFNGNELEDYDTYMRRIEDERKSKRNATTA